MFRHETLEDRVNYMRDSFQKAMQQYEAFSKDVKNVLDIVSSFKPSINSISASHEDLAKHVASFIDSTGNAFTKINNQVNSLSSSLKELSSEQDYSKKYYQELNSILGTVKADISKLFNSQANFASLASFSDLRKNITDLNTEQKHLFDHVQSSFLGVIDEHKKLKDFVNALASDVINVKEKIRVNADWPQHLSANINGVLSKLNAGLEEIRKFVQDRVKAQIEAIPKPPLPPSLEDAKKAMQTQVDPALLDAKNANLRSQNNEAKIHILEKKIESLQLLLNKYQLQG